MNEEIKKEEIVEETIENDSEEVIENEEVGEFSDSSNTSEEQEEKEQPKMLTEEEANELAEKIAKQRESRAWKKAEREKERVLKDYNDIFDTLKAGMGTEDIEEIKKSLNNFYTEQGVKVERSNKLTEKQERILAKAEADEIIELGEDEINQVANDIYNIPLEKRTVREKVIFEMLGNHMLEEKAKKSLIDNGIDLSILEDKEFKNFASKFNANTQLSDIYDMYNKINIQKDKVEKPKSTGSVKNIVTTNEIKEFYTPEEVSKFSMKDLDNPQLMKAVEKSMSKWK